MHIHKDISAHPTSGGLAHPSTLDNRLDIQRQVEDNLRIWRALEALRNGRIPSNAQLDRFIAYIIARCPPSGFPTLSSDTLEVFSNARVLLNTIRVIIREKNGDELVQNTLWLMYVESSPGSRKRQAPAPKPPAGPRAPPESAYRQRPPSPGESSDSSGSDSDSDVEDPRPGEVDSDNELTQAVEGAASDLEEPEGELAQAIRHIRQLTMIVVSNPEVRRAIISLVELGRDMMGGDSGNNSDEERRPNGGDAMQALPDSDADADDHFEDALSDISDASSDSFRIPGAYHPGNVGAAAADDTGPSGDPTAGRTGPDPRVSQFVNLLRQAILQEKEGYIEAMEWLVTIVHDYEMDKVAHLEHPEMPAGYYPRLNPGLRNILRNVVTIIERLNREKSLSPVERATAKLYEHILDVPNLRELWEEIDIFIGRVLAEKGYVNTEECLAQGNSLYERADACLQDGLYRAQWNAIYYGLASWFGLGDSSRTKRRKRKADDFFQDDPLTRGLEKDWARLVSSLFLDSAGKAIYKRTIWSDLWGMVFPLLKGFGYIPFPRIESDGPNVKLVLENVFVSLANLLPAFLTITTNDVLKVSPFDELGGICGDGTRTRVRMRAEQIQADVRDALLSFRIRDKMSDSGIVDILLTRNGLTVDVELELNLVPNSSSIVKTKDIKITIDELTLRACDTRHDSLYRLLLPSVAVPLLKRRMAYKMQRRFKQIVKKLDAELLELRYRIQRVNAKTDARRRRGETVSGTAGARLATVLFERYQELRAIAQAKEEAEHQSLASNGLPRPKFKISARLEDALLAELTHDPNVSIVYRRHKEEAAVRITDSAVPTGTNTPATATGLRAGRAEWRSSVFSFRDA